MEWLGFLILFGAIAFIAGRRYTKRIDRIEAEKAAAAKAEAREPMRPHQ